MDWLGIFHIVCWVIIVCNLVWAAFNIRETNKNQAEITRLLEKRRTHTRGYNE